jgi:hypothetical protein
VGLLQFASALLDDGCQVLLAVGKEIGQPGQQGDDDQPSDLKDAQWLLYGGEPVRCA